MRSVSAAGRNYPWKPRQAGADGTLGGAQLFEGPTLGTVSRSFTAAGRLSGWVEPNGDEHTRIYDGAGRVREEVNALGNSTIYGYDAAGRLENIVDVALGATTTFEMDGSITPSDYLPREVVGAGEVLAAPVRLQPPLSARPRSPMAIGPGRAPHFEGP